MVMFTGLGPAGCAVVANTPSAAGDGGGDGDRPIAVLPGGSRFCGVDRARQDAGAVGN